MVSWAEDTVLLEPYNFKRNFYRIEIQPDTGEERMQVSDACECGSMM
jgi:hypothetical protein